MSNTQVAIDAVKKLYEVTEQRDELLKVLSEVQEFLQYLWRDVAMNEYGADYRDRLELYIDNAIANTKGEK